MSTPDIEELRKLAQAATPGIWFHIQRGISRWHGERIEVDLNPICDFAMLQDCCVHEYDRAYENAAYIQAVNPAAIIGLIDTIQAQAERIKELEWQLAEIEKAEPVIWAISYDGVTPYTLWHEGDGPLLDGEVKRQGGTTQKLALFTRPMPVQSAEHCLWARNGHEPCQRVKPAQDVNAELVEALEKLARLGNGDQYGNSDGNMIARTALAKHKGAK